MPPKKLPHKLPEEVVVPAEKIQEVKLSHTKARKLMQDPNDGRKKPKSEAQQKAWQKCMEARNAYHARKREERVKPVEAPTEGMVKVKVMPKRTRKPKEVPAPSLEEDQTDDYSCEEEVEELPPKPAPKVRAPPKQKVVYATDTQDETELSDPDELPADVKKRVLVPRKVKQAVQKIKAINQTIAQVNQNPALTALNNIWKPRV